jgi:hypothetical protein
MVLICSCILGLAVGKFSHGGWSCTRANGIDLLWHP